jgi:DNA-binding response OmpR family regulator
MKRSKILIVDDDFMLLNSTRNMVESSYLVAIARDGDEALKKFVSFRPDVILLDINMPGLNGYEVCREIRSKWPDELTKIIFVSGNIMASDRLDGFESGGNDFVVKPFFPDELQTKIRYFTRLKITEELELIKDSALRLAVNFNSETSISEVHRLRAAKKAIDICDVLYAKALFQPEKLDLACFLEQLVQSFTENSSVKDVIGVSNGQGAFVFSVNSQLLSFCLNGFLELVSAVTPVPVGTMVFFAVNEEKTRVELKIEFKIVEPFAMPSLEMGFRELCERIKVADLSALNQVLVRACLSAMGADMRISNDREAGKAVVSVFMPVS